MVALEQTGEMTANDANARHKFEILVNGARRPRGILSHRLPKQESALDLPWLKITAAGRCWLPAAIAFCCACMLECRTNIIDVGRLQNVQEPVNRLNGHKILDVVDEGMRRQFVPCWLRTPRRER